MIPARRGGGHVEIIAEHDSVKSKLQAQDITDPAPREPGRARIKAFVNDMGGHDTGKFRRSEALEWNEIGKLEILVGTVIDGKRTVRIGDDAAVPREVLPDTADIGISHPGQKRTRKRADRVGVMMISAVANNACRFRDPNREPERS